MYKYNKNSDMITPKFSNKLLLIFSDY